MLRNKQIAIVSPCPLFNLGLKQILNEYFSAPRIDLYAEPGLFFASSPESYDFYFTSTDLFFIYCEFFLPRKNNTILLVKEPFKNEYNTTEPALQIHTYAPENDVIEQLQSIFGKLCRQSENKPRIALTAREIEVLQLIAQGYINKEIANVLHISFNTVLSHRKNIIAKLGIKTVSGLSFYAMINGYVSINTNE
ncbi:MAG: helix-turn-helix transcriptional regulator [Coprobacter sp.]|nr:helix-turn-helix transcriptional regulator [Coprobacter sp.]